MALRALPPPLPRDDVANAARTNAISLHQRRDQIGVAFSDVLHVRFGKSCERVLLAHRAYAIRKIVGGILDWKRPAKVISSVVASVSVPMRGVMENRWARAVKRFADKAVHLFGAWLPVDDQVQLRITVRQRLGQQLAGKRPWTVARAPNGTQVRHLVIRGAGDYPPFLIGLVHAAKFTSGTNPNQGISGGWK